MITYRLFVRFLLLSTFLLIGANSFSQKQSFWEEYQNDTIRRYRALLSVKTDSGYTEQSNPKYNHIKGGFYEIRHKLISKGEFMNNKKVNTWYSFYDTPLINDSKTSDSIVFYKSDSAIFEHLYTKEIVKSEKTYVDGNLNGLYKMFYKNGNIKSEINFINNNPSGAVRLYYENGQIMFSGNIILNEDFYNGTEYYDTGSERRERKMSISYVLENFSDLKVY